MVQPARDDEANRGRARRYAGAVDASTSHVCRAAVARTVCAGPAITRRQPAPGRSPSDPFGRFRGPADTRHGQPYVCDGEREGVGWACHMTAPVSTQTNVSAVTVVSGALREPVRERLDKQLERHHSDYFAWAVACCHGDRTEAEDVLQTSYLKVLDGQARFAGRSSFKTWLCGVIRRTAAEQRRRRVLRRLWGAHPLNTMALVDPSPHPDAVVSRSESAARLAAALETLPQRQREVLHLVFYQDLTIREAAEVLGVSIGTARAHYERGKNRLREHLSRENDG
jgi:RNA polymerase sigma factor (sigma-70 family)